MKVSKLKAGIAGNTATRNNCNRWKTSKFFGEIGCTNHENLEILTIICHNRRIPKRSSQDVRTFITYTSNLALINSVVTLTLRWTQRRRFAKRINGYLRQKEFFWVEKVNGHLHRNKRSPLTPIALLHEFIWKENRGSSWFSCSQHLRFTSFAEITSIEADSIFP